MPKFPGTELEFDTQANPNQISFFPTERSRGLGKTYCHSNVFEIFLFETLRPFLDDPIDGGFETGFLTPVSTRTLWEQWLGQQETGLPSLATILVNRLQQASESFFDPDGSEIGEITAPPQQMLQTNRGIGAGVGCPAHQSAAEETLLGLRSRLESERHRFFSHP